MINFKRMFWLKFDLKMILCQKSLGKEIFHNIQHYLTDWIVLQIGFETIAPILNAWTFKKIYHVIIALISQSIVIPALGLLSWNVIGDSPISMSSYGVTRPQWGTVALPLKRIFTTLLLVNMELIIIANMAMNLCSKDLLETHQGPLFLTWFNCNPSMGK